MLSYTVGTFCTLRGYTKKTDHINMNENNSSFSSLCGVIDNPG